MIKSMAFRAKIARASSARFGKSRRVRGQWPGENNSVFKGGDFRGQDPLFTYGPVPWSRSAGHETQELPYQTQTEIKIAGVPGGGDPVIDQKGRRGFGVTLKRPYRPVEMGKAFDGHLIARGDNAKASRTISHHVFVRDDQRSRTGFPPKAIGSQPDVSETPEFIPVFVGRGACRTVKMGDQLMAIAEAQGGHIGLNLLLQPVIHRILPGQTIGNTGTAAKDDEARRCG